MSTHLQTTVLAAGLRSPLGCCVAEHREHQGEGHSFFLTAEPYLSAAAATTVEGLYTADYNGLTASVPLAADSKVSDLPNHLTPSPCV